MRQLQEDAKHGQHLRQDQAVECSDVRDNRNGGRARSSLLGCSLRHLHRFCKSVGLIRTLRHAALASRCSLPATRGNNKITLAHVADSTAVLGTRQLGFLPDGFVGFCPELGDERKHSWSHTFQESGQMASIGGLSLSVHQSLCHCSIAHSSKFRFADSLCHSPCITGCRERVGEPKFCVRRPNARSLQHLFCRKQCTSRFQSGGLHPKPRIFCQARQRVAGCGADQGPQAQPQGGGGLILEGFGSLCCGFPADMNYGRRQRGSSQWFSAGMIGPATLF